MRFFFLEVIPIFVEETSCYHNVDCIIYSSFDVSGVIRLTRKVINKDLTDIGVFQSTIPLKKLNKFVWDEFKSFYFLLISFFLLIQSAFENSL